MAKIGIFYGSTEGNTERVSTKIQEKFGGDDIVALHNVNSATADDMAQYDYLILACPTWDIGELQEDWDAFLDEVEEVDYREKMVTYLGLGDAEGYPDTFIDAPGIIHERIADSGAKFVGFWPTEGYDFEESKSIVDGKFLGLVIDDDNQKDMTDGRVTQWVEQLKSEGFGA
ncbi:MAG: flavodoxin [Cyclobacteriaceae bacterium]|nr:flavodoxin [Cyclobacteriaceae bacterium HetDA_MAG_MS6]